MTIKTLNNHELLVAFSTLQDQAMLHVRYPSEDRNEKSRSAVSHSLRDSGHHEVASAIDNGVTFIAFDDVAQAVKLREAIESHSAALSAHLYWKGLENDQVTEVVLRTKHAQTTSYPRFGHRSDKH